MQQPPHIITNPSDTNLGTSDEMTVKDLVLKLRAFRAYVYSKWYIVLLFCALGLGLALVYINIKVPKYIASTTFVLDDKSTPRMGGQYSGLAALAGIDVGGGDGIFEGENIIELYRSRKMIESALLSPIDSTAGTELLIDRYVTINNVREKWQNDSKLKSLNFHVSDPKLTRVKDSVLSSFVVDIRNNYLKVERPDKKLSIISVSIKSKNEYFSEVFDRKMVETVNNFYSQTKNKKALQNLRILQRQADSVRAVFGNDIYRTAAAADVTTPNLNPTRQRLLVPGQKYQFNADASRAILNQLIQNLEVAKISVRNETPLIQVIDLPIMPLPIDKANVPKAVFLGLIAGLFLAIVFLICKRVYAKLKAY